MISYIHGGGGGGEAIAHPVRNQVVNKLNFTEKAITELKSFGEKTFRLISDQVTLTPHSHKSYP